MCIQIKLYKCRKKDYLTDLDNITTLEKKFKKHKKKKGNERGSLIVLSIANLTSLNNTYGHINGDRIMQYVACILKQKKSKQVKVYRIWGDRFAMVLYGKASKNKVQCFIKDILECLGENIYLKEQKIKLVVRIGVVFYNPSSINIRELLGQAELSMKEAVKEEGVYYFEESMLLREKEELSIEQCIREGLEEKRFYLCYQPKVNLKTFEVDEVEALIRLEVPGKGFVSPEKLIHIAENTGLIITIGWWVLEESINFIAKFNRTNHITKRVAINVSVLQLLQSDFVDKLDKLLNQYKVEPICIQLEVTETILIEMSEYLVSVLKKIRQLGIKIAIDDFGKGYSNLSYLQYLPIDVIKIDKTFMRMAKQSNNGYVLLDTILKICKDFDLLAVAEGVETKEEMKYLIDKGCHYAQGYLFSRPVREEALLNIIKLIESNKWV